MRVQQFGHTGTVLSDDLGVALRWLQLSVDGHARRQHRGRALWCIADPKPEGPVLGQPDIHGHAADQQHRMESARSHGLVQQQHRGTLGKRYCFFLLSFSSPRLCSTPDASQYLVWALHWGVLL